MLLDRNRQQFDAIAADMFFHLFGGFATEQLVLSPALQLDRNPCVGTGPNRFKGHIDAARLQSRKAIFRSLAGAAPPSDNGAT